jgi:hypothetical protein
MSKQVHTSRAVWSLVADIVIVIVFAIIGRASHGEALSLGGIATTTWPFLVALLVGWAALFAWRSPARPVRIGLPLWAVTVAGGMLLRVVSGQGTAVPFIIVASVFLLLTLVGWRVVAALVARRRQPARSAS